MGSSCLCVHVCRDLDFASTETQKPCNVPFENFKKWNFVTAPIFFFSAPAPNTICVFCVDGRQLRLDYANDGKKEEDPKQPAAMATQQQKLLTLFHTHTQKTSKGGDDRNDGEVSGKEREACQPLSRKRVRYGEKEEEEEEEEQKRQEDENEVATYQKRLRATLTPVAQSKQQGKQGVYLIHQVEEEDMNPLYIWKIVSDKVSAPWLELLKTYNNASAQSHPIEHQKIKTWVAEVGVFLEYTAKVGAQIVVDEEETLLGSFYFYNRAG